MATVTIPLTRGKVAIIDEADYPLISQYSWHASPSKKSWYAMARIDGKTVYMHRLIMGDPPGLDIDHASLDGLDNRRENLREATLSQNRANTPKRSHNQSGYKGVHVREQAGQERWIADIRHNGEGIYLGIFETPEDAARAYDNKARELHGEFARLNFPNETLRPTRSIIQTNNRSGYRGVARHNRSGKWSAEFKRNGVRVRKSGFATAEEAARAYDEIARASLGDKAKCNFP